MKHATIVPLIGGMTIGAENAFGKRPEYLLSYEPFYNNDKHLLNYYNFEVPYYQLDDNQFPPNTKVDVITACCPCAGLSMLSQGYGDDNQNNKWMIATANYILGELKSRVFFGENAPGFAGKIGKTVRDELFDIGLKNGYTMTVYRTRSLDHGIPQVRERSFYFFWQDDKVPLLNFFSKERDTIENLILSARGNSQREPINKKIPSQSDPYYKYILQALHGGISHAEFCKIIEPSKARGSDVLNYIESTDGGYEKVKLWMADNGYPKEVDKCQYRIDKLAAGGNIMKRSTVIPRDYIGAFVGHYPTSLTHPVEDRYINYREAMTIMGLPQHFELVNASPKNVNHICQNVPVGTATDMATEVYAYLNGERDMINAKQVFQYNHSKSCVITDVEKTSLENFFV